MARGVPRSIGNRYWRKIRSLIQEDRSDIWEAFQEEIRPRIHQYRNRMNTNLRSNLVANDSLDEIRDILDRLREGAMEDTLSKAALTTMAREFVNAINARARMDFRDQMQAVVGLDPTVNEPWLSSFLETAVQENVSWIRSIGNEYHDQVETIVIQGVRRGVNINDMAHDIAEVGDVSLNRGKFIARDQLGSIHGDLTKRRHQELGLDEFVWRTSDDERVRDSHAELDGETFTWKMGAINERGERIWPGTDYNCRCVAEAVEDELKEVAEAA